MPEFERIEHNGQVLALILRSKLSSEGVNFYTPDELSFQLGILIHRKGVEIRPHAHIQQKREIIDSLEALHIDSGKVEVDMYTEEGERVDTKHLEEGDTILFIQGGHGLRVLEDTKIIEVRQGPYLGVEVEKRFFL